MRLKKPRFCWRKSRSLNKKLFSNFWLLKGSSDEGVHLAAAAAAAALRLVCVEEQELGCTSCFYCYSSAPSGDKAHKLCMYKKNHEKNS